jgi:hypothetical protein
MARLKTLPLLLLTTASAASVAAGAESKVPMPTASHVTVDLNPFHLAPCGCVGHRRFLP